MNPHFPHFPHLTLETYRKVQVWEVWEVRVYFALSHYNMKVRQKQKNDLFFCFVLTFLYLCKLNNTYRYESRTDKQYY